MREERKEGQEKCSSYSPEFSVPQFLGADPWSSRELGPATSTSEVRGPRGCPDACDAEEE